jgi:hypothetical protein
VAIDGTCLDVADTPANQAAFGRPGTGRGQGVGAFPQVRLVGLAECGTHAITRVSIGPCTTGELSLAPQVVEGLGPGTLALADRGLLAVALWRQAVATGAALLWRAKTGSTGHALPADRVLADGSWRSRLDAGGHRRGDPRGPVTVRVLDDTIDDPRPGQQQAYRLVTSMLDSAQAPAKELAASTTSAGSWRARWTSSRPTSAAPARCCAPRPPKVSSRRSTPTCWSTTPSGRCCTRPPWMPTPTRTG